MNDIKEEALKLADEIDINGGWHYLTKASDMIRKLVDELNTAPRELSDEEIMKISNGENLSEQIFFWSRDSLLVFARAILKKASEK